MIMAFASCVIRHRILFPISNREGKAIARKTKLYDDQNDIDDVDDDENHEDDDDDENKS